MATEQPHARKAGRGEEGRRKRIQLLDLDHLRYGGTRLGLSVMRRARLRHRYQPAPNADRFDAETEPRQRSYTQNHQREIYRKD
ncbi:hypothetical protein SAY87_005497 [Trapa incisa]|uniref:Uncharacterized protein n=1 Tax=Trapa incisa TaxID=236973 RepID=A0AAN7K8Y3_9MYRT|nr:hypothetical protein SAY87_005497 [Trapa incisa]